MVVVAGMFAKVASRWATFTLACDLKLDHHLLLFAGLSEEKFLFFVRTFDVIGSLILSVQ